MDGKTNLWIFKIKCICWCNKILTVVSCFIFFGESAGFSVFDVFDVDEFDEFDVDEFDEFDEFDIFDEFLLNLELDELGTFDADKSSFIMVKSLIDFFDMINW